MDIKKSTNEVHKEVTNPLQKDACKRGLDNLEIKEKRKMQKKDNEKSDKKERKKMRKSIKELTEIMKELEEIIESKADDLTVISSRVHKEVTNPLQKDAGKRELDNLEIKEKRKKQKKDNEKSDRKERKKFGKSIKDLTEIMKQLKEITESKADYRHVILRVIPFRPPVVEPECNFGNKDHLIDLNGSFFVRGFDASFPREEIKKSLLKHFESHGFQVKTVYVPIVCATGLSFGYAFIEVQNCSYSNVLKLDGSRFEGGGILLVEYAKFKSECSEHPDVEGCKRCRAYMPWLHRRRPLATAVPPPPRRNWRRRTVGTPYSQIGRFTSNITRVFN